MIFNCEYSVDYDAETIRLRAPTADVAAAKARFRARRYAPLVSGALEIHFLLRDHSDNVVGRGFVAGTGDDE
jgi:hypothetical protein